MNIDDQYRQFLLSQQLPPSIGDDHSNPLPSWDTEMEPALPEPAPPVGLVEEDPGESYDPNNPADADPVQPPTMMQSLAEGVRDMPDFDPQSFLDQPAPVAGVDQGFDPTQFVEMSQGETFTEVFAAEPTTRLLLRNEIERQAAEQGLDPKLAASLASTLVGSADGTGPTVMGLSAADFTPIGFWNDFQEAIMGLGDDLSQTSVMDNVDVGSAAMNAGIAMAQAVPLPFVAARFLSKAGKYIDGVKSGAIQPGMSIRSVDDAGNPVAISEVLEGAEEATDLSDIGTFSAVSRAVKALPQEKGSAQQMRAMITKGEGVKAEEMAWIGLDDFLKGRKNVTKQEIADFVDANQVEVKQVTKDMDSDAAREESIYIHELLKDGEITEDAALAAQEAITAREAKFGPRGWHDLPSEDLNVPGGENYREVLLTLPVQHGITELPPNYVVEKVTEGMGNRPMYGVKEPGSQYIGFKDNRDDAIADALRVINEVQNKTKNTEAFRAGHFDEPNVLAHIRLDDRTGPGGERILFVEEIQSDWHQKGRKSGYKKDASNRDRELDFVESQLDELAPKSKANKDHIDAGGDRSRLPFPNIGRDIEAFMDRRSELVSEMAKFKDGVPDAPFKKTWYEMSMRRVIRMAAEEGYDSVAWTPGKVQAERYDFSRHIDRVVYHERVEGAGSLTAYKGDEIVMTKDMADSAKEMPEIIGKEAADHLRAVEPEIAATGDEVKRYWALHAKKGDVPNWETGALNPEEITEYYALKPLVNKQHGARVLESVDMEIGGEGMKGFYDKMLKNYTAKFGKKFGAKVGTTTIDGDVSAWTIPITPKMRDSVLKKGVPLFGAGAGVAAVAEGSQDGS